MLRNARLKATGRQRQVNVWLDAGPITPAQAIMASCNPFFYQMGAELYSSAAGRAKGEDARTLALSRVTYPGPKDWEEGFDALHDQLAILVDKGPAGGPMVDRKNPDLAGIPESPATQSEHPKMPGLRSLDLILLASLHPTVAQMVGLYFVDQTVEELKRRGADIAVEPRTIRPGVRIAFVAVHEWVDGVEALFGGQQWYNWTIDADAKAAAQQ